MASEDDDQANIMSILQQAPVEKTYDDVKSAYYNASKDIAQTIANLWELPPLPEKPKKIGDNYEKWDEIRDICDEFDAVASKSLAEAIKQSREQREKSEQNSEMVSIEQYTEQKHI